MFDYFHFSLPRAVTEQLVERLSQLTSTPLTDEALEQLTAFQIAKEANQGVYVIYHMGVAVYAGKAVGLAERLKQHLWKLRGRQGIDIQEVGLKALLLDENWSTSANEDLLINHFKSHNECRWNGIGFGPKDPGKNRDGGEPNWFDKNYPIREDYIIQNVPNETTVATLLACIKAQVPYLFRYDVPAVEGATAINLTGIERTALALVIKATQALGNSWQLMQFKNGFTLYRTNKTYEHGTQLLP